MADLYNRIDALAKERGYKNMTALCNAAGVPRATMTELKMGRSKSLLPETARKLAAALGVSLDAVFGIDKEKKETPAAQGDGLVMYRDIITGLCGNDQEKLRLLQGALSKEPEKTKASFDLFLKTL